jgi:membrane-bound lytic murein transglycosylase D
MGEEGLKTQIQVQKVNNYYQLYLPLETQRFVLRIISAKLILSNPEKYGFRLSEEDLYPPLEFDRIKLKCSQRTPIHVVAQAAKTYFKVIKDLNPEIRGYYLSKGSHPILIPKGASKGFHSRYKKLLKQRLANNEEQIYIVKKGDSLSSIAERFNVPLPALLIWNGLNPKKDIYPGDRLIIYPNEVKK